MWHVLLLAALAFPQVESAAALLREYDLSGLCAAAGAVEARQLPSVEILARLVQEHVLTSDSSSVKVVGPAALLVRASAAEHDAAEVLFNRARAESRDAYGVFCMRAEVPRGRYGEPAQALRFVALKGAGAFAATARSTGEERLEVVVLGAEEDGAARIDINGEELESPSFEGAPSRPLRRLIFSEPRTTRFIEGYDLLSNVEGRPQGLAVPRFKELQEGLQLEGVFIPVPAEAGVPSSVRLFLDLKIGVVARPVPVVEAEHGPVHYPVLATGTVEATVTFTLGEGFAILVPGGAQDETETLLAIWVNETDASGR